MGQTSLKTGQVRRWGTTYALEHDWCAELQESAVIDTEPTKLSLSQNPA